MAEPKPKRGRPPAKHSSDDYAQMSLYVHKTVRSLVRIELLREAEQSTEPNSGEFSGLVEALLRGWLKQRGVKVASARKTATKR
jgi:hypothetical protein